jgi:opacity protein-like surface antigen
MTRLNSRFLSLCAAAVSAIAADAHATVIDSQDFEGDPGTLFGGWLANGNQMTFTDEFGTFIGLPYLDFWGAELRNDNTESPVIGDLTKYTGGMNYTASIRLFALDSFFGDPIDPANYPVVIEFIDYGDPNNPFDNVSVYKIGDTVPQIAEGWKTFSFDVPDPSQDELPDGWGGTGAEDPVTFEPILPPGRTYASVMASVDEVRISTFVPGFFYGANFWQIGFDDAVVTGEITSCPADFDGSGFVDTEDFDAFVRAYEAGDDSADFDGTGFVDTDDFDAFVRAFETGC